jgi:hypothetical protein
MMRFVTLLALLLCLPVGASAKIYKLAVPSNQGFELYWWPVLPEISGWHQDDAANEEHGVNALVPNGQSFNTAPAIIYAKADYKPHMADTKTLTQFIAGDIASFRHDVPDEQISLLEPLHDGDGQILPCYSFISKHNGSWEIVAYGVDDDYYLIFTVSAFNSAALMAAQPVFNTLVERYKK